MNILHSKSHDIIVIEAAVLIQAKWQYVCHEIWTCIIPQDEVGCWIIIFVYLFNKTIVHQSYYIILPFYLYLYKIFLNNHVIINFLLTLNKRIYFIGDKTSNGKKWAIRRNSKDAN